MKEEELKRLLERYISRTATEEDYRRLSELLEKETGAWTRVIRKMMEQEPIDREYDPSRWEQTINRILRKGGKAGRSVKRKNRLRMRKMAAAAAIVILTGIGVSIYIHIRHKQDRAGVAQLSDLKNDIRPGGPKALLTLGNGQHIILDSMQNGPIVSQGSARVVKLKSGQLAYNREQGDAVRDVYNTLQTPPGGQYELILPDGSRVWLNAASSIRFPVTFQEKERRVFITGEAYFEVARDAVKPFVVSAGDMQVRVLGTHFNIMAYANEPVMKTTLLSGAVEIAEKDALAKLKPGQQAVLRPVQGDQSHIAVKENIDVSEAVAWKSGLFQFSDDGIEYVMRQIARWYDVEIIYADSVPDVHITGKIPQNTNLTDVLKMMELSGIRFRLEGRKVIVLT
ncbi:FecR family protein [Compostibacter hankyongensis]|uniref:DUF4974 domain-containing protein n=1 Tax=Compostibacter hankyongensis TaxID=1007089 RepID=A0ABP8FE68_9BACT